MSECLKRFAYDGMAFEEIFRDMKSELGVKLKLATEFYEFDFEKVREDRT